ncbi:MAG: DUF2812 domain-containing protein [Firmicutes bacterium]|nr:DUF2812 domain-containing protein [Bacillota bacterium]
MTQTKFIPSGGLAFVEEKDLRKISKYAKEGWILESFAMLGYRLKKGEPRNIEYEIDYQTGVDEDYFAYFEEAGWSHVCSAGDEIHVFSAPVGTKPIYSDKETIIEKYEREKRQMGKYALPFLLSYVLYFLLYALSKSTWVPEMVGMVSVFLGIVTMIGLVFTGLPYIAYSFKLNKLRKP